MLVLAIDSVSAMAACVPLALPGLAVWVHVQVETLWVRALAVLCKKPALWHPLQVILMKVFAEVTFLAEAPKPVFADDTAFAAPRRH